MYENWYKTAQYASEYSPTDQLMGPGDIASQNTFKNYMTQYDGSLDGNSLNAIGLNPKQNVHTNEHGIMVQKCGDEPGSNGGCQLALSEYGKWFDYGVEINEKKYRVYKCKNCHHQIKPFNIQYSKNPVKKKKEKRKVVHRLSSNLSIRIIEAQYPRSQPGGFPGNMWSGQGYNNPANQPMGRMDLSDDARMFPWSKFHENNEEDEYDHQIQKGKQRGKIIKMKDKKGKEKYIRVVYVDGADGMPGNVYTNKGRLKKQPRYNPADGKGGEGYGAWAHNRDDTKGWYGSNFGNNMDGDMRMRVIPWDQYIRDRSTSMMTLTRPY